jgi:hypothetical protein
MMKKYIFIVAISFIVLIAGSCAPSHMVLYGFIEQPRFSEQTLEYRFDPDARVVINAPASSALDPTKPNWLIVFALPNGNSIEWTIGKKVKDSMDWHFGIQQIGAQTRKLRATIKGYNIFVAYIEASKKSWPAWRREHPDSTLLTQNLLASIKEKLPAVSKITLTGHSGGGSYIFGLINTYEQIPDDIDRISFLDSNYGYSDSLGHGDKFVEWLRRDSTHCFSIICYDDRNITLKGKSVVSPTGGTFRRTMETIVRIKKDFVLEETFVRDCRYYHGLNGRIDIIIHTNPKNEILHTILVGPMNGFIHAMTVGTPYENKTGEFNTIPAYEMYIED